MGEPATAEVRQLHVKRLPNGQVIAEPSIEGSDLLHREECGSSHWMYLKEGDCLTMNHLRYVVQRREWIVGGESEWRLSRLIFYVTPLTRIEVPSVITP